LVEATVVYAASDTLVVSYRTRTYPSVASYADTLLLESLDSLDVLRVAQEPRMSVGKGAIGGAILGGLVGAIVAVAGASRSGGETFVAPELVGAPIGALLGSVAGMALAGAQLRSGERWEPVPLR